MYRSVALDSLSQSTVSTLLHGALAKLVFDNRLSLVRRWTLLAPRWTEQSGVPAILPPEDLACWLLDDVYAVCVFSPPTQAIRSRIVLLTEAEREVAALASRGCSNAEIAKQRSISLRTVANQIGSAYRKLGVSSRSELVRALARLPPGA